MRPLEARALRAWANSQNLQLSNDLFTRKWQAGGEHQGMEHDVYFEEESQRWWKRNSLMASSHYLEFLQRIQLHNWLFPETAMRLEGFAEDTSGLAPVPLYPICSQPHIDAARGAKPSEVRRYLAPLGFLPHAHDESDPDKEGNVNYYLPHLGILLEDLHDENVFIHPATAQPIVVDPIIVFHPATKFNRLHAELALPVKSDG